MSDVINLAEKFSRFSELWSPRVIAEMIRPPYAVFKKGLSRAQKKTARKTAENTA